MQHSMLESFCTRIVALSSPLPLFCTPAFCASDSSHSGGSFPIWTSAAPLLFLIIFVSSSCMFGSRPHQMPHSGQSAVAFFSLAIKRLYIQTLHFWLSQVCNSHGIAIIPRNQIRFWTLRVFLWRLAVSRFH